MAGGLVGSGFVWVFRKGTACGQQLSRGAEDMARVADVSVSPCGAQAGDGVCGGSVTHHTIASRDRRIKEWQLQKFKQEAWKKENPDVTWLKEEKQVSC